MNELQYRRLCYNDIQPLFSIRGISRALVPYRDVQVEYPVLTGAFMDISGRLLRLLQRLGAVSVADDRSYFHISAALLAPFAVATTMMLRPRVQARRLMVWAFGTPLVIYAFHNWDLLAVAAAVWALAAFERKTNGWAGLAAAAGASAKLYPAFLVPAMILARWSKDDKRAAGRLSLAFVVGYAALNLPWALASGGGLNAATSGLAYLSGEVSLREAGTNGWLGVWIFHADRYPDFGSLWFWVAHHGKVLVPSLPWMGRGYVEFVNAASLLLFVSAGGLALFAGWRRRNDAEGYPAAGVSLAIVAVFLLTSKVHSPQYALWVTPFLAMLAMPWRWVSLYFVADLAVYVCTFYYFTVDNQTAPGWMGLLEASVWARAAVLYAIAWWSIRVRRLTPTH